MTTGTAYPWKTGADKNVTEATWRDMAEEWLAEGVIEQRTGLPIGGSFKVSTSTGLTVAHNSGQAWMRGTFCQASGGTATLDANASGNPRKDRIVARLDMVNRTFVIDKVTGTPAGSPTAPALQQVADGIWEIPIATIDVANGASSLSAGNIQDDRYRAVPRQGAGGQIGYAQATSNQAGISSSVTDLSGLTVTVNSPGRRRFRISGKFRVQQLTAAAVTNEAYIREGATVLDVSSWTIAVSGWAVHYLDVTITPSSGIHTYKLSHATPAGTSTVNAAATYPAWIKVEDAGPLAA